MSRGTLSDDLTAFESSWLMAALRRLEKTALWGEDSATLADELAGVAQAAAAAVAAGPCALYLADEQTGTLLCAAATGLPENTAAFERLPDKGFCHDAIAAGQLIVIEDIHKDTRRDALLQICKGAGLRALWMIPLKTTQHEAVGCLVLYWRAPRRPQPRELEWVQLYARNAALTIDNARLREQASRDRTQLQSVLDQMPEGVLIARAPDGETILMNRAGLAMAGALPKKLMVADYPQQWVLQDVDGGEIQLSDWPMMRALRGESLVNKPYRSVLADGQIRYFQINSGPLRREDGAIFGGIVIFRDITDEQLAADALRESEAKFRHIYENAPVMMYSIDEAGYLRNVNRRWLEETGYTREEAIGRRADFLMTEESAARTISEVLPRFWREGFVRDESYQYVKKDGTIIDVIGNCEATTDPSGKRISLSVVHNVTEQRRAENALRATEEKFTRGFAASPLPMSIRRLSDGRFLDVNDTYLRIIRRPREEVIGRTPVELGLWADPADHERLMEMVRKQKSVRNLELNFTYRPGHNSISLFSADVIVLDGEECILTIANDITKRKEAEAKLQASEAELRALFAAMTDIIFVLDDEGRCLKIAPTNPAFNFKPYAEVLGKTLREILPAAGADLFLDAVSRALATSQPVNIEYSPVINQVFRCFAVIVSPMLENTVVCVARDITERKRREEQIQAARLEWQTTFDALTDSILLVDNDDRLIRANMAFYDRLGQPPQACVGNTIKDLLHSNRGWTDYESCPICQLRRKGERSQIEFPAGLVSDYPMLVSFDPIIDNNGHKVGIVQTTRDLSALYLAREEAERERTSLLATIEQMADGLLVCDETGAVVHANHPAQALLGFTLEQLCRDRARALSECRFSHLDGRVIPGDEHPVQKALRERRVVEESSVWYLQPDDHKVLLSITASPFFNEQEQLAGVVALLRDVTEQQREHERVQQADKLRALGQLASGVAHNFNNALAAVIGYTQLALPKVKDPDIEKYLRVVEQSAKDAARMVERIQNFSRGRSRADEFQPVRIGDIVRDAIDITRPRWRHDAEALGIKYEVKLEWEGEAEALVKGEASELREVCVNIIFNALDAMPLGGRLGIEVGSREEEVRLRFVDTGGGMTEEIKRRVFEPFFTTKGAAGLGMGLSESYRIVERHGGRIEVDSQLQRGASFTIILPLVNLSAAQEAAPPPAADIGKARALVIDDEEVVGGTLAAILESLGHEVTQATSGEEALALVKDQVFDIIFTDLAMPKMDGIAVASEIRARSPRTKIVLVSGYGFDMIYERLGDSQVVDAALVKPFIIEDIERAMELLDTAQ